MATYTAGPAYPGEVKNLDDLDLITPLAKVAGDRSSTHFTVTLDVGDVITIDGTGFTFDTAGHVTGGTMTSLSETDTGVFVGSITGTSLALPVTNNATALQTMFAGSDQFTGSGEADFIRGFAGNDTLAGGGGSNTLFGGDGADSISGGAAFNQVNGNTGEDTIVGRSAVGDWLLGGQGNDVIDASASSAGNIINGNIGIDTITGGAGADTIRGGQGDDVIQGGAGNDIIYGDLGQNTITGGAGADTFRNGAAAGRDVITDFQQSQGDHIQIAANLTYTTAQSGADVLVTVSNGFDFVVQNTQLSSLTTGWIGS